MKQRDLSGSGYSGRLSLIEQGVEFCFAQVSIEMENERVEVGTSLTFADAKLQRVTNVVACDFKRTARFPAIVAVIGQAFVGRRIGSKICRNVDAVCAAIESTSPIVRRVGSCFREVQAVRQMAS